MPDWTPLVSTMSEERYALLQLVKLCRRYRAQIMAANTALQLLAPENPSLASRVLAAKEELRHTSEQEVEIEFRPLESALIDGNEFLPALQELLKRRQSVS